ncbi:NAD-binding protein [Capillimicrobium parvum]|uniref:RCK N-terminal domain-containing protein n=1 Tax=Capillimicrobium parvum TaxID=2884022 RepID=A0A9E6Y211_9ACTN|nr:NAD-binding protein [Capillimicrobium parvum]UGS37971.1 hypothetical protein DSM104329_04393 [Capillimicrobium parvum]
MHALDPGTVAGDGGGWPFLAVMLAVTLGGLIVVSALIGVIATTLDEKLLELRKGRSFVIESGHTLVLGFNSRAGTILGEIDHYVAPGSQVTVVADGDAAHDEIDTARAGLRNAEVEFRTGSITDRATLEALNVGSYDHVIVLCYADHLDAQRADARTLITLLHLRDIVSRLDRPISIVSEMLDDRNHELAQVTQVDDVIVSDKVLSLLLAQISENAALAAVFRELFESDGSEIYLRPVEEYVAAGGETTFATVVVAARQRGESAIGLRLAEAAGTRPPATACG